MKNFYNRGACLKNEFMLMQKMGLNATKPVVKVSDRVSPKPVSSATEMS